MDDHDGSFRQVEDHLERGDAAEVEVEDLKREAEEDERQKLDLEERLRVVRFDLENALRQKEEGDGRFRLLQESAAEVRERVRTLEDEAEAKSALLQKLEEDLRTARTALADSQARAREISDRLTGMEARVSKALTVCRERSFDEIAAGFADDLLLMVAAEKKKETPSFKSIITYSHKDFIEGHEKAINSECAVALPIL